MKWEEELASLSVSSTAYVSTTNPLTTCEGDFLPVITVTKKWSVRDVMSPATVTKTASVGASMWTSVPPKPQRSLQLDPDPCATVMWMPETHGGCTVG